MIKPTPNPPETDGQIDSDSEHSSRKPAAATRRPSPIFTIAPNVNNETLLVHACETLASASVMASELAFILSGPKCNLALGIQQMIALAELSVNRVLDQVDPQ
ncbi:MULTISPECIES: DUF6124 family protein [unclassified Pseudomonas]|jgi:hypothetical protein|uniref:DUF6124 family protein n=1 Tax=unclassified Pseudomonas TaxID=196821 RepID=UPI0015B59372|nr:MULTISPECIES: DUF6124 family protein [unclassified Pseudomonas]